MNFTRQWWNNELAKYDVYISELVIAEIMRTENEIRRKKLFGLVSRFPELEIIEDLNEIAQGYRVILIDKFCHPRVLMMHSMLPLHLFIE